MHFVVYYVELHSVRLNCIQVLILHVYLLNRELYIAVQFVYSLNLQIPLSSKLNISYCYYWEILT